MHVLVLGAGISGVATAYFLARLGCEVTVVDRAPGPAEETSFANGGVVGGTQIEPWAGPGQPWQILKWIGHDEAPFLIRLREIPRILGWGAKFLRNCTTARFQQNLATSGRLTRHSLAMFSRIREEAAIHPEDYRLIRRGALKLYFTQESYTAACTDISELRALGFEVEPIGPKLCIEREPGLAPALHSLIGGILYEEEEVGDCRSFARILSDRASKAGVTFIFSTAIFRFRLSGDRVYAVETEAGPLTADAYVVATASYTAPILRTAGISVPVVPIKGVTITVPAAPWPDAVRSAVMDHSRLFGLIRIGDHLRVSGSAEVAGYNTVPDDKRCDAILSNVLELFPDFRPCLETGPQYRWGGLRGNSPDGPPIIGSTPLRNLYLNVGHGPQGWSTSCGAADLVASVVAGRTPAIPLDGLTLARFSGRRE